MAEREDRALTRAQVFQHLLKEVFRRENKDPLELIFSQNRIISVGDIMALSGSTIEKMTYQDSNSAENWKYGQEIQGLSGISRIGNDNYRKKIDYQKWIGQTR